MNPLIAKLEAATGPSRELDAEIDCAVRFPDLRPARPDDHKEHQRGYPPSAGNIWCPTGFLMASSYTSSIDAALTLVPEGYGWNLQGNTNSFYAVVRGYKNKVSPTPAIALCIAALRARETTLKGEGR